MTQETLKLFFRATFRYKWLVFWSELSALIFILSVDIFSPMVVSRVIDRLSKPDVTSLHFSTFVPYIELFLILQVVYISAGRVMMQTYIRLEPNAIRDLENLSYFKLQGHSMAFFADNFSGALVAKVNRLTNAYKSFVETVLADFFNLILKYIAALIVIAFLNTIIALVFLVWTLLFCISVVYLHKRKLHHSRAASASQTKVTARLADIITNTLTIRSFARTEEEAKRFTALTQERRDLRFLSYLMSDYIRLYKTLIIVVLDVTVLSLSIYFSIHGALSVGSIVLIQLYLFQLIGQLWNFGRFMDHIEESIADAAEMTEILMRPHEVVDSSHPEDSRISDGAITFEHVTFQYPGSQVQNFVLKDFNLTIPAGQKVGLVGPSGGGKTTLTKLLLRFMDINSGAISIDGQNIAHLAQENLRAHIAYVPQEPLLFHRTIMENIAYGKQDATEVEVQAAADKAHATEFIDQLPQRYDTLVGERGVKLSGGQRQRVAIARAMLKEAPIIILDEATSSLDSVSEKLITQALDHLMEKRTTIVIAHRLSTIRKMDRILVLDTDGIREDGTHEELLKKQGLYAELWSHQSGDFIGE